MTIPAVTRFIRVHPQTGQREMSTGAEFRNGRIVPVSLPRISLQGWESDSPPQAVEPMAIPRVFSRHKKPEDYAAHETPSDRARRAQIKIPRWVKEAGLAEDFVDIAMIEDEFEAAAYCRAEKKRRSLS